VTQWRIRLLPLLFILHAVITAAGAAVLIVVPTAIPAFVDIPLAPSQYLLTYLLGAAELTVAVVSFGAARLRDVASVRLIVAAFVTLHLTSAAVEVLYALVASAHWIVIANVGVRLVFAGAFLVAWRVWLPSTSSRR
jgi:hypothetical protein